MQLTLRWLLRSGWLVGAIALGSLLTTAPFALGDTGHGSPTPHTPDNEADHHGSASLEIPPGQPIPTVNLVVYPDPVRGWNLEIQTTNFRFAPEQVNQANRPGEGHGHLYINGDYVSRVYGPWLHLPTLPSGRNEITVSLNANGHERLTHNGALIEATAIVVVP